MPGAAEPSPAAISGMILSVIHLPVPVITARLQKAVRSFLHLALPCLSLLVFQGVNLGFIQHRLGAYGMLIGQYIYF